MVGAKLACIEGAIKPGLQGIRSDRIPQACSVGFSSTRNKDLCIQHPPHNKVNELQQTCAIFCDHVTNHYIVIM